MKVQTHSSIKGFLSLLIALMIFTLPVLAWAEEGAPANPVPGEGLIDEAALNAWADSFAQERQLDTAYRDFSIGFCYTGTGECWFYNADTWMYSASLYKVPVSMLLAEKVASGELTQESIVNGTTVEYLESTALVYSNNDSGHSIVSYLGGTYAGKCSDQTEKYTDLSADYFSSDFLDVSYYTARYMTQVMKTLYDGGEERFPHVTEFLLQAQPGAYFKLSPEMENNYQIAQKYGAYEEPNGNNNNHCAAIIYTPTPIVVVVMTRNVPEHQTVISQVGEHLAAYSLELDRKAEALAREAAERAAAEQAAAEADATTIEMPLPESDSAELAFEETENALPVVTEDAAIPAAGEKSAKGLPTAVLLIAVALLVLIAAALMILLRLRRNAELDDGDDAEDDEDFPAEIPTRRKRPTSKTETEYKPRH